MANKKLTQPNHRLPSLRQRHAQPTAPTWRRFGGERRSAQNGLACEQRYGDAQNSHLEDTQNDGKPRTLAERIQPLGNVTVAWLVVFFFEMVFLKIPKLGQWLNGLNFLGLHIK